MTTYLRPDEAAAWIGVSLANVRVIAHRRGWRREDRRYHIDDVEAEVQRRASRLPLPTDIHPRVT